MAADLLEDVRRVVADSIDRRTILDVGSVARELSATHGTLSLRAVELTLAEAAARALVPMKLGRTEALGEGARASARDGTVAAPPPG